MLDSMTSSARISAFADELEKIGARKALKLIRGLINQGGDEALDKANRIATSTKRVVKDVSPAQQKAKKMHKRLLKTDPAKAARLEKMMLRGRGAGVDPMAVGGPKSYGAIKKTRAGSQIKQLGSGMEGTSTLTASQKGGIEVRKVIDPKGIAGKKMVANREASGKALKGSSDVAEFRGGYDTPGGLRAQKFEYAPGKGPQATMDAAKGPSTAPSQPKARRAPAPQQPAASMPTSTGTAPPRGAVNMPAARPAVSTATGGGMSQQARTAAQLKRLKLQGKKQGFDIADLHEGNVMVGKSGGGKAVDYITVPKNKDVGLNKGNFAKAMDAQDAAAAGKRTPYLDYLEDPRRAGNVMARAFAKAPPLTPGSSTALRKARMPQKPMARPAVQAPARPAGHPSTAPSRPAVMPRTNQLSTAPSRPKAMRPMAV